jgi:hypothetical protein
MRERYFVVVSVLYIAIGSVIIVRSALAHVLIIGVLGVVFMALGVVRLKDYAARNKSI